jgi:outer membrane protein
LLVPGLAHAQSDATPVAPSEGGGVLGAALAAVPRYQGADQTVARLVPVLDYRWSNGAFIGGEHEALAGMRLAGPSQLQYGAGLGADAGRKAHMNSPLAGVGKVPARALLVGKVPARALLVAFAKAPLAGPLTLDASLRFGSGEDRSGAQLRIGAAYRVPLGASAHVSVHGRATLANASYMQSYFGVSAAQADSTGYQPHAPAGGLLDVRFGLNGYWQLNRDYSVLAGASVARLGKPVQDSPLVRKKQSPEVFLGFARRL